MDLTELQRESHAIATAQGRWTLNPPSANSSHESMAR